MLQRNEKKEEKIFMSLDNIQLSDQTCEILFSHNLIEDQASNVAAKSQNKIEIASLGENQKHVLFLVNDPSSKFLADEEMELLTKFIAACKLSMADIALVNLIQINIIMHNSIEHFNQKKSCFWGSQPQNLNCHSTFLISRYKNFQQQFYLTAPSLKEFLNNKHLKKELWMSLQKLFL